ncbi:uncharacterized protein B0H64DRAFT_96888 [Chaetomium fimeti]|uniref:Uncharacterized protein n=1 Tax=Chaetomium fimeti TaxID=1854472 RepID=A0AAE0HMK5_9PEZI|nr:hypothetical protein B0H64DRAFT_96888 [Chaetomium fimeti]
MTQCSDRGNSQILAWVVKAGLRLTSTTKVGGVVLNSEVKAPYHGKYCITRCFVKISRTCLVLQAIKAITLPRLSCRSCPSAPHEGGESGRAILLGGGGELVGPSRAFRAWLPWTPLVPAQRRDRGHSSNRVSCLLCKYHSLIPNYSLLLPMISALCSILSSFYRVLFVFL